MKNKEKGITLVALVVTIIILLILAGVAINMALGDNGLFKKSKEAVNTWKSAEKNESDTLGYLDQEWDNLIGDSSGSEDMITFTVDGIQYTTKAGSTWSKFIEETDSVNWCVGYDEKMDYGNCSGYVWTSIDYELVTIEYINWSDNFAAYSRKLIGPDGKLVKGSDVIFEHSYKNYRTSEVLLETIHGELPDFKIVRN